MPRIQKEIIINSAQGLHARPAALFVQMASKYTADVSISKDGDRVNGKSIMGILTLGAQKGSRVLVEIDGDHAEELMAEIEELLTKEET